MPAGGKTEDADAMRVELPIAGMAPDSANRPAHIPQLDRMMILGPEPILEHHAGHTQCIEPFRDRLAFVAGESAVATAGADDDRCAVGLVFGRAIDRNRWSIRIIFPESAGRVAVPE